MAQLNDLMAQAIHIARTQYGERVYEYKRVSHNWQSGRKRGQRGQWFTTIGDTIITREEYETNVKQGEAASRAAFRGKLKRKTHYYHYRRDQVGDGWQDKLIAMIESADSA